MEIKFFIARYDRYPYLDAPGTFLVRHKHILVVVALGGLYLWKMLQSKIANGERNKHRIVTKSMRWHHGMT